VLVATAMEFGPEGKGWLLATCPAMRLEITVPMGLENPRQHQGRKHRQS
jgi:hypothetical protein